jgi:endonuclease/exonuclease/phosphatase family metal-dependent hydrolase
MDGKHSPERIAEVIGSVAPDVVCLQELDLRRAKTLRADQSRLIADHLGMTFEFHPTVKREDEHFGDAVLSKHPMRLVRATTFPPVPRPIPNERRGAVWVEIAMGSESWQIINTHFGLGREERRLQAKHFATEWIAKAMPGPLVVCGDLNSRPGSYVHRLLGSDVMDVHRSSGTRRRRTFSTRFPLICLDYIFATPEVRVHRVEVVRTPLSRIASDHFPIVADLENALKLSGS